MSTSTLKKNVEIKKLQNAALLISSKMLFLLKKNYDTGLELAT